MYIIKLNAIDSTNSYLKKLALEKPLAPFTVVWTTNQTNGRGQMGSNWVSEEGKNLTFSVLVKDVVESIEGIFDLNVCVAVTLIEVLENYNLSNLAIKWPNDILADKKKIAGVLIENSIKSSGEIVSIVGIGINVNQENFSDLPQASSLKKQTGISNDVEKILHHFLMRFAANLEAFQAQGVASFWEKYHQFLFKWKQPAAFETNDNARFMGSIQEVTKKGLLRIKLEDDCVKEFEVKSIKFLI